MTLSMIGSYGMDEEVGLINYDVILNSNLETDISLMERSKEILEKFYTETKEILKENRKYLDSIAGKLLDKESLIEEEINEILAS